MIDNQNHRVPFILGAPLTRKRARISITRWALAAIERPPRAAIERLFATL